MTRRLACLTVLLLCPAAAVADQKPALMPNLADGWRLRMPAGFEYDATLEPTGEPGRFRLKCGATLLRGVYEFRRDRLSMIRPEDPQMKGLVWEVKDENRLVLVEHPEESRPGQDYRGATLTRQRGDRPIKGPAKGGR